MVRSGGTRGERIVPSEPHAGALWWEREAHISQIERKLGRREEEDCVVVAGEDTGPERLCHIIKLCLYPQSNGEPCWVPG